MYGKSSVKRQVDRHSIDDIAENFVEEDVLREFRSGTLSAWLEEYGYEEELERVRSIKPTAIQKKDAERLDSVGKAVAYLQSNGY